LSAASLSVGGRGGSRRAWGLSEGQSI